LGKGGLNNPSLADKFHVQSFLRLADLIVRPYSFTAIHAELAFGLAHHVFDDGIIDYFFGFEQFEHFAAK